jgi:selenocysteine-specific elongation factor
MGTMTSAFAPFPRTTLTQTVTYTTAVFAKGKKVKEDLSFIETRDMTRAEMEELNRKNEEIMNMELSMMTGFSLVLSLPILYLCWVAFFSD